MYRTLGFTVISLGLMACGSAGTTSSTGETASAISAAAGDATTATTTDASTCIATYVTCVRDGGTKCKDDLHACIHPKSDDGGQGCDGDHHGKPEGDGGPGGPEHGPADGEGHGPPGGGHGERPDGAARKACTDALDTCAAGTDTPEACAAAAKTCLDALPKPPHPSH